MLGFGRCSPTCACSLTSVSWGGVLTACRLPPVPCPAELKQITWVSATGLLMVVFGECLRKAAMFTAGSNFNHVVQNEKSDTHTLVTSGVYAWFRHPSYVGWFYWSIGTQVPQQARRCCPSGLFRLRQVRAHSVGQGFSAVLCAPSLSL